MAYLLFLPNILLTLRPGLLRFYFFHPQRGGHTANVAATFVYASTIVHALSRYVSKNFLVTLSKVSCRHSSVWAMLDVGKPIIGFLQHGSWRLKNISTPFENLFGPHTRQCSFSRVIWSGSPCLDASCSSGPKSVLHHCLLGAREGFGYCMPGVALVGEELAGPYPKKRAFQF